MTVAVIHRAELCRYEVQVSGRPAGYAEYVDVCGTRIFVGARVDPEFEGHGLGSAMMHAVLEMERTAGNRIQARCTLMRRFIDRYPEYRRLLAQRVSSKPRKLSRRIGNTSVSDQVGPRPVDSSVSPSSVSPSPASLSSVSPSRAKLTAAHLSESTSVFAV